MGGDFRVGPWLVQPGLNTITNNGTTVRLEPKVMEVLVCLANQAGEPITKDELLQAVWRDTFVSDDVLVRSISELRRVFEDDPRQPQFIQTIPKRGYRLLARVVPINGTTLAGSVSQPSDDSQTATGKLNLLSSWHRAAGLGGAVLVLLVALGVGGFRGMLRPASSPAIHSLAVLPLQNLSGDAEQDYFVDGLTEELITELSRLNAMKVISRTSVMRYKKSSKSLPEIARELNVDAILEGSVLRSGDRVRITAQLIQAQTDANLWAETYDRSLGDTLRLQETVATAIAGKIKANLSHGTTEAKAEHVVNLKAHEAYLRGLQQYGWEGDAGNHLGMEAAEREHHQKALAYFEEAIRIDPQYAPAYVALAGASLDVEQAEGYARKALEADIRSADGHLILAAIALQRDRRWQDAEREILQALELNPSSAAAHQQYAFFLDAAGRLEEGMKEYQRAQELDPATDHMLGALYSRHKFNEVIETAQAGLARTPDDFTTSAGAYHKTLMVAYARTGKQKESMEQFRAALTSMGYTSMAEQLRRAFLQGGYEGALRAWLKLDRRDFPFRYMDAYVYTELGDYDHAFALLPKTLVSGPYRIEWDAAYSNADTTMFPTPVTIRIDPLWDPLHSDPRFDELVRAVGFPQ